MKLRYIPNLLTCLRFLLIVPVTVTLVQERYLIALYLFVLAGITDAFDGLLARYCGWTSRFGAIADPLADKLLLMSSFGALYYLQLIPLWLVLVIVGRDLWIMSGVLSYRCLIGHLEFTPSVISKINTFFQILLVPLYLLDLSIMPMPKILLELVMYIVLVTSVVSFIHYSWVWGSRALKNHKAKAKAEKSLKRQISHSLSARREEAV